VWKKRSLARGSRRGGRRRKRGRVSRQRQSVKQFWELGGVPYGTGECAAGVISGNERELPVTCCTEVAGWLQHEGRKGSLLQNQRAGRCNGINGLAISIVDGANVHMSSKPILRNKNARVQGAARRWFCNNDPLRPSCCNQRATSVQHVTGSSPLHFLMIHPAGAFTCSYGRPPNSHKLFSPDWRCFETRPSSPVCLPVADPC